MIVLSVGALVTYRLMTTSADDSKTEIVVTKHGEEYGRYSINTDQTAAGVIDFMSRNNLSFPVLVDLQGEAAEKYGIQYPPTSFLIDKKGIVVKYRVGAFATKEEIENQWIKLVLQENANEKYRLFVWWC